MDSGIKKSPTARSKDISCLKNLDFSVLVKSIAVVHEELRQAAARSFSRALTIRNWLVGCYMVEYEQKGADRAEYGSGLIGAISGALSGRGMKGVSPTNLKLFRQFYLEYPGLHRAIQEDVSFVGVVKKIGQALPDQSALSITHSSVPGESCQQLSPDPLLLLRQFSYTHFVELIKIKDPLKRIFYEVEGLKGSWNYRQLKRQIGSLLYERTAMSKSKATVVKRAHAMNTAISIEDTIRDPYVLEFAGLREHYSYAEADLEVAILDHIQEFMLEMGNGFCFEARQKRITLDNEHDRIDLVFYHRILRCHVLIDLKVRKFSHGDAGQMNFYLNYFRDNVMTPGDNPPVGLILCTHRDETVVKYATAGLDNKLFVSKYLIALPSEREIMEFLRDDRERTELRLEESRAHYEGARS